MDSKQQDLEEAVEMILAQLERRPVKNPRTVYNDGYEIEIWTDEMNRKGFWE